MSRNTLLLVVSSLLALTACSNGICAAVAVTTSGPNTNINFGQCWDEQDRSVACVRRGGRRGVSCTCAVNGNTGETFTRTGPLAFATPPTEEQLAPINTGCGWELRPR